MDQNVVLQKCVSYSVGVCSQFNNIWVALPCWNTSFHACYHAEYGQFIWVYKVVKVKTLKTTGTVHRNKFHCKAMLPIVCLLCVTTHQISTTTMGESSNPKLCWGSWDSFIHHFQCRKIFWIQWWIYFSNPSKNGIYIARKPRAWAAPNNRKRLLPENCFYSMAGSELPLVVDTDL